VKLAKRHLTQLKPRKTCISLASRSSFSWSSPSPTSLSKSDLTHGDAVPFVELIAQTNFSFLQGASHPEEMIVRAKQLGYAGLGVCDTNGVYGIVRGYQADAKPSLFDANELAFLGSDRKPKQAFQYLVGSILTPHETSPIALMPMNKEGYAHLCHLITKTKRESPKGEIALSLEEICEANDHLLAFPLPPWSEATLKRLKEAFGDRVYLPVHRDYTWESIQLYRHALSIEHTLKIPAFATGRPLYHTPDRKPLHDVVTCILHKTTLKDAATKLTLNRERHLKSPAEIAALFRERPDLLARTVEIAKRVTFSLTELRYRYPRENLPEGKTATEHLRDLVEVGLRERYQAKIDEWARTPANTLEKKRHAVFLQKVRAQVDEELSLIAELGYEDYFLTLKEICLFAEAKGILHQGRGSAANSIVCYTLKLTNVCPIRQGLMFGRFLSRERAEPPDVDIDFEHARREEILQHIYERYGVHRAAMVCTVIRYRSRLALREVGKVIGLELWQIDALVKFMGREGLDGLLNEGMKPLEKIGLSSQQFQRLLALSLELHGFPRHLGIHSGGFVISNEPIANIVPIESATKDKRFVIQWNKDDIDILGLMKLDMLSLGMLTAVKKCLDLLRECRGVDWDMSQFPHGDVPTYDMICEADTIGVFQIESRAQMSLLPRLKPRSYYDLVVEVAIVRPGPIIGGMVHPYLKRRDGLEKVTYEHEKLRPILSRTYGVPLFQEQVMQIAVDIAGFTPGEADELRRVVSSAWKKKHVMEGLRQRVINGMLANNVRQEYAEQIFKTIEGFSSYGFPESHAASFALITYISCYLKRHHPDLFTCALLNSQPMGFYSPRQLIADAQRHGVRILPLDIQFSHWDACVRDPNPSERREPTTFRERPFDIRIGFCSVYGIKRDHIEAAIRERERGGLFQDLTDFIRRTRLPKATLIRLAAAGALQSVDGMSPRESMWTIQSLCFDEKSLLFGHHSGLDEDRLTSEAKDVPRETTWEEMQREYKTKGFSVESHPLGILRATLESESVRYFKACELKTLKHRTKLRVAGLISLLQRPPTAKGMSFATIEDETGLMNVIITPDVYARCRLLVRNAPLLEIDGVLECVRGVYNIRAHDVRPLLKTPGLLPGRLQAGEVSYGKNV
jgi:DNA polymerase-3 subunit alpha/error-prone DNA polymerase